MTAEEILALPDDGIDRELIRRRTQGATDDVIGIGTHSGIEATVADAPRELARQTQPAPRGKIHSGEAGFRLQRDPETFVGIDVAYASAELVAATDPNASFYDGAPVLAVEILSPSDRHGDVVGEGRALPRSRVGRLGGRPGLPERQRPPAGQVVETFNETQELSGDPELPGFRVRVAELFS